MEEIRYLQKNKNSHPNFGHNNINFDLRFTKLILKQLKKIREINVKKINTAKGIKLDQISTHIVWILIHFITL